MHHLILMLRVGSFMVAAPFFGARYLPLQVRIVVSVVLPLPLQGLVPLPPVEQIAALTG
ncbi:flagellar biosynthetic protein FliR [Gemmobacter lanyuensis]